MSGKEVRGLKKYFAGYYVPIKKGGGYD